MFHVVEKNGKIEWLGESDVNHNIAHAQAVNCGFFFALIDGKHCSLVGHLLEIDEQILKPKPSQHEENEHSRESEYHPGSKVHLGRLFVGSEKHRTNLHLL